MAILGYACINTQLRDKDIYTGRSLIQRTFTIDKASDLALQNCKDLLTILDWNVKHNIKAFRVGSDIFPRQTEKLYKLEDLKHHLQIKNILIEVGKYAKANDIILSCHPGPFTVLGSSRSDVVDKSIIEVETHNDIINLICTDAPDLQFNINFHVGLKFADDVAPRFISAFNRLSDSAKRRVILENDDKLGGWSVKKLYDNIFKHTSIPITYDHHHSSFSKESDLTHEEEFNIALLTWIGRNEFQEVHMAESASKEKNIPKHSDYIESQIPKFITDTDMLYVTLEAKQKELALMQYRSKYNVTY